MKCDQFSRTGAGAFAAVEERQPLEQVNVLLVLQQGPMQRRDQLVAFMGERGGRITEERMVGLLLMITAMPEYQLC